MRHIHSSAKFNREPCRKNQEPSKAKRPIKFYAEKIKIGSHKLAQKSDFKAKFYASLLKKPLFSYKLVK